MSKPLDEKIAKLEARLAQAKARAAQERKEIDKRLRDILGGATLTLAQADPAAFARVLTVLDPLIVAKSHRKAVGLPPRDQGSPADFFKPSEGGI